jgi:hypothetical protein
MVEVHTQYHTRLYSNVFVKILAHHRFYLFFLRMMHRRNPSVVESDSSDEQEIHEETPPRSRSNHPNMGEDLATSCRVVRPPGLMEVAVGRPRIHPVGPDPRQIHMHGKQQVMMMVGKMMRLTFPLPTPLLFVGWSSTGRRPVVLAMSQ